MFGGEHDQVTSWKSFNTPNRFSLNKMITFQEQKVDFERQFLKI